MSTNTLQTVKSDPISSIAVFVLFASGAALVALLGFQRHAIAIPPIPLRYDLRPPVDWRDDPNDVLTVPGYRVAYWGRPLGDHNETSALPSHKVEYGKHVSREAQSFRGIVIHFNRPLPAIRLVEYQHNGDRGRGGSYGYHFYVTRSGDIIQGAPLSVRTNHVKPASHSQRKAGVAKGLDSRNLVGISGVGACGLSSKAATSRCVSWNATPSQEAAIRANVKALQTRYNLPCRNVWGHGELQHDRRSFEGTELAERIRASCGL